MATLRTTRRRTRISLSSLEQARRIAALAQEKLAEDVVILDMRPVCTFTDYFVIATGRNPRQTAAIWDEVHGRLKQDEQLIPRTWDGTQEGTWILADYLDVVLHVFTPEAREYYKLEELWNDVPAVELDAAAGGLAGFAAHRPDRDHVDHDEQGGDGGARAEQGVATSRVADAAGDQRDQQQEAAEVGGDEADAEPGRVLGERVEMLLRIRPFRADAHHDPAGQRDEDE